MRNYTTFTSLILIGEFQKQLFTDSRKVVIFCDAAVLSIFCSLFPTYIGKIAFRIVICRKFSISHEGEYKFKEMRHQVQINASQSDVTKENKVFYVTANEEISQRNTKSE